MEVKEKLSFKELWCLESNAAGKSKGMKMVLANGRPLVILLRLFE